MSLAPHFFRGRKPARWRLTLACNCLALLNRNGLGAAGTARHTVAAPNMRGAACAQSCALETSPRSPVPPADRGWRSAASLRELKCQLALALLVFSGFVAWPQEKIAQPKGD